MKDENPSVSLKAKSLLPVSRQPGGDLPDHITRRRMVGEGLALLGGICGAGWMLGREPKAASATPKQAPPLPWKYIPLDGALTAARAYELHAKKHCMYAVFYSVLGQLGEELGPPHSTFPFDMMVYGVGGIAGWGSVCGALNGAAAVISLLGENDRKRTELLVQIGSVSGWLGLTARSLCRAS